MPLITTFFWTYPAFSGSSQLNLGPFFVGHVNKFFRVEIRGELNYQGAVVGSSGVFANFPAWGVQQVPHTAAAEDVITSFDSETWFARRQTGSNDVGVAWAPDTDNAAVLASVALSEDWAGQLAVGLDTDIWVSFKSATGASVPNFNVFGTVRLWWG